MTMNCIHCDTDRARLMPPLPEAEINEKSLLLDGKAGGRPTVYPQSEIVACDCRCHAIWKMVNGLGR